jgi:hypothetical protein
MSVIGFLAAMLLIGGLGVLTTFGWQEWKRRR